MKSYHSVSGRLEGRDLCEIGLMAQYLLAFLPICPEFKALKTDICNAALWRQSGVVVSVTPSHAYSHCIYSVNTQK